MKLVAHERAARIVVLVRFHEHETPHTCCSTRGDGGRGFAGCMRKTARSCHGCNCILVLHSDLNAMLT